VPATATVHSAFGAVMSDLHVTTELSDPMHSPSWGGAIDVFDPKHIMSQFVRLETSARDTLIASGAQPALISLNRFADVKLRMQAKSLSVPVPTGELDRAAIRVLLEKFCAQFEELYGSEALFLDAGVEIVSFRVQGKGELDRPQVQHVTSGSRDSDRKVQARAVYLGPRRRETMADVVRGIDLKAGDTVRGPAIIEHPGTTIFVGPGQSARVDDLENTVITTGADGI
jgi:N-methylhydantoinase A